MRETSGRIRWSAVAIGFIVDSLISQVVSLIGYQFDPTLVNGISFATRASTVTAVFLVLSTGLGGWLAGRLAKHEYVLHGALVGGVGIMIMLVGSLFGQQVRLPEILLQCAATALAALGGWLSRWVPAPKQ